MFFVLFLMGTSFYSVFDSSSRTSRDSFSDRGINMSTLIDCIAFLHLIFTSVDHAANRIRFVLVPLPVCVFSWYSMFAHDLMKLNVNM